MGLAEKSARWVWPAPLAFSGHISATTRNLNLALVALESRQLDLSNACSASFELSEFKKLESHDPKWFWLGLAKPISRILAKPISSWPNPSVIPSGKEYLSIAMTTRARSGQETLVLRQWIDAFVGWIDAFVIVL